MQEQMYHYFHEVEDRHWWFQGRKEVVLAFIDRYSRSAKERKILDVGCGTGMMLQALKEYGEVWGLDKSVKAIEYSRTRAPGAHLMQGSFPEQIPQGQFDIITFLDVLEHIENDKEALRKLVDILQPNGTLIITVPAYQFLWTSRDDMNEHKRRYTLPELREKILGANLQIKKISYYNTLLFAPIALLKLVSRFLLRSPKSHFGAKQPSAWINFSLRILFSFEKYLLSFMNFPFGISLIVVAKRK